MFYREEPNVVFEDNKAYSVINVEINGGEEVPSYLSVQVHVMSLYTAFDEGFFLPLLHVNLLQRLLARFPKF